MQTENSHHVCWEPKMQNENSRCSHTWHRGDARETIARLKASLDKVEDEAGCSDATLASVQRLLEHINKAMQNFRKCHHRGYCWWHGTSRTSWTNRKIRQLSYHPTHTDPLRTIKWLIYLVTACTNRQLLKCVRRTQRALEQISGVVTSATAGKTDLNKCFLHVAQYESQLGEVKAQLSRISRESLLLNQRTKTCPNWKMMCTRSIMFSPSRSAAHFMVKTKARHPWMTNWSQVTKIGGSQFQWELCELHVALRETCLPKFALKGCSAKHVVEGLSSSGDDYSEVADCLQKRYDRPRLIY